MQVEIALQIPQIFFVPSHMATELARQNVVKVSIPSFIIESRKADVKTAFRLAAAFGGADAIQG